MNQKWQEALIYTFKKEDTTVSQPVYVVKDSYERQATDPEYTYLYQEDFESLLRFPIATKNRRSKQLLSWQESESLIQKIAYGALAFTADGIPYSVALNHLWLEGQLYFHSALTGYKLTGLTVPVSYLIVEDLGINEAKRTHNHASVYLQGHLEKVNDEATKQKVMHTMLQQLTPSQKMSIPSQMLQQVMITTLRPQYIIGKQHVR